ncbi:neprilysin-1-like [Oratosquilla oratoria]|uniref:neprilysin-1-like n=1 Tax=Oratosquilla oratoria TaxID=337810 RepID=UPI003F76D4D6
MVQESSDTHRNGFVPGSSARNERTPSGGGSGGADPSELQPLQKPDEEKTSVSPQSEGDEEVRVTIRENPLGHDQEPPWGATAATAAAGNAGGGRPSRCCGPSLQKYLLASTLLLALAFVALLAWVMLVRQEPESNICLTEECVRTAASLLNAMDQTADPCHDFFQYACGTWNKRHVIPADRASISTFEVMADQLQLILRVLLESDIEANEGSATQKAKLFYASCMNFTERHEVGDKPLREVIDLLGGWPVTVEGDWTLPDFSVEEMVGRLRGRYNQAILIDQWVGPDDKNSSVNIIQLDQMQQLGLPSREYFLRKNSSQDALKAYLRFMTDVAELLGAKGEKAKNDLQEVLDLETQIANATLPQADRHDTGSNYIKLSLADLQREVPEFNWTEYLGAFIEEDLEPEEPIVVYAMPYFKLLGKILQKTEPRVIWNYVLWRLVQDFTPHLTSDYQARRHEFRKVLLGIQSDRNRWNQCIDITNKRLGMAVGALFIKENFNPESKETALEMIHTLREAFSDLLEENDWMDDETRAVAREKANAMNEKIGYPDLLTKPDELAKEYENLTIVENRYLENFFNLMEFDAHKNLARLRQMVNKTKWSTAPAVLNAFYNPNFNDIVFPAGILQPLFYSQHFPKSLNYGGIGVVIGHEMTHGFDDKGRQFDKDGNLKQWWNTRTIEAFRERTQCIIDQYSGYKVDEVDQYINGRMTQGENIADNGGIKQAYRAYRQWVERNGEEKLLPGMNLNHDQLFFLNYAQIWCGSMRSEDALSKIRSSVHSLGPIRVLGPLSNSEDFARAYSCPLRSRMNPVKKCSVW